MLAKGPVILGTLKIFFALFINNGQRKKQGINWINKLILDEIILNVCIPGGMQIPHFELIAFFPILTGSADISFWSF